MIQQKFHTTNSNKFYKKTQNPQKEHFFFGPTERNHLLMLRTLLRWANSLFYNATFSSMTPHLLSFSSLQYYSFSLTVIIAACCEYVNRIWTCIESHLFILFLVGNS